MRRKCGIRMHKKYWAGMHRKYHVKMYKKYYMRMYRFVLTVTGETRNLVTKTRQEEENEHINKQGHRKISGNGGHGTDRKTADIFHCINSMWRSNCSSDI